MTFVFSSTTNTLLTIEESPISILESSTQLDLIEQNNTETDRIIVFFNDFLIPPIPRTITIVNKFEFIPSLVLEGSMDELQKFIDSNLQKISSFCSDKTQNIGIHDVDGSSSIQGSFARDLVDLPDTQVADGSGVIIGIIDSGIDSGHQELTDKVIASKSFVLKEHGYAEDVTEVIDIDGHGTWVAGIASGKTMGIAPNSKLIDAKIFHGATIGNGGIAGEETTSALLAAMDFCVQEGADILSLSLGQYHNLPVGPRQDAVNYISNHYGIPVVIAAGNSGNSLRDGGTIDNPGTALQAITVSSARNEEEISAFSSTGPKIDRSMKPDISGPGNAISGPDAGSQNGIHTGSGTSAATPVISGSIALLLDYSRRNNITVTPGTMKAALMGSANHMLYAPEWASGAGYVDPINAVDALQELKGEISLDTIYLHPVEIPFDPFSSTLFINQTLELNITLINGVNSEFDFIFTGTASTFCTVNHDERIFGNSSIIPLTIHIPYNTIPGIYNAKLEAISSNNDIAQCDISFEVKKAEYCVLFDEKHTILSRRSHTTSLGDQNTIFGMFREFASLLIDKAISLDTFLNGSLSQELLQSYDAIVLVSPGSVIQDPLVDWSLDQDSVLFSDSEVDNLVEYYEKGGGILLFIDKTANVTNVNMLLARFGLKITDHYIPDQVGMASAIAKYEDTSTAFTFLGREISTTSEGSTVPGTIFTLATVNGVAGAMGIEDCEGGGRLLVFGSSAFCDNFGLLGVYDSNKISNNQITASVVSWVCGATENPLTFILSSVQGPLPTFFSSGGEIFGVCLLLVILEWRRKKRQNSGFN